MNDYLRRRDLSALKIKVAVAASVTVQKCAVSAEAGLREHCNPKRLTVHACGMKSQRLRSALSETIDNEVRITSRQSEVALQMR